MTPFACELRGADLDGGEIPERIREQFIYLIKWLIKLTLLIVGKSW